MGPRTPYHRRVSTLLSVISGNTLPLLKVFLNHHALSGHKGQVTERDL